MRGKQQIGWGTRGWGATKSNPYNDLKRMSNALFIDPARPDGTLTPKLAPRTLQNGVSNTDYQQNVSVDVVITSGMVSSITNRTNYAQAQISFTALPFAPISAISAIQGTFNIPNWVEKIAVISGDYNGQEFATEVAQRLWFNFPLNTTIEQARTLLAGTVIRYQLATPIDTLNSPVRNPLLDQAGKVGKNLADLPKYFSVGQFGTTVSCFGDLLANTSYAVSLVVPNGDQYYANENLFNFDAVTGDGTRKTVILTTLGNVSKLNSGQFSANNGWTIFKNNLATTSGNASQLQIELGSVATAYAPYGKANVLMNNMAWTNLDGYKVEPLINEYKGEPVTFTNLLGNDGNMIDSNADNRADGWTYVAATGVSCVGNEVVFLPTASYGTITKTAEVRAQNIGDDLYFCCYLKSTSDQTSVEYNRGGSNIIKNHSGDGSYQFFSVFGSLINKTSSNLAIYSTSSSGWTNITAKQTHLFNLTAMFPNRDKRPTQAQMDSLVQSAIARYGYVNERIIKIAWEVFLNLDGSDSFGALNSASAPNPTGTDDFWQLVCYRADLFNYARYYGISRNLDSTETAQYGFIDGSGGTVMRIVVNGVSSALIGNSDLNLKYVLFGRINGRLFANVNGVEVLDSAYVTAITTRPNTQLNSRSNSVDGLSKIGFSDGLQGICAMGVGAQGTIDKAKVYKAVSKLMKQMYGLGV